MSTLFEIVVKLAFSLHGLAPFSLFFPVKSPETFFFVASVIYKSFGPLGEGEGSGQRRKAEPETVN